MGSIYTKTNFSSPRITTPAPLYCICLAADETHSFASFYKWTQADEKRIIVTNDRGEAQYFTPSEFHRHFRYIPGL